MASYLKNEISIVDIIQLLKKKWWIVVVSFIITSGIAFGYTKLYIPSTYLSRGMLYVNNTNAINRDNLQNPTNRNINLSDLVASKTLAATYIEILNSDSFMRKVSVNSGMYESVSRLRSMISINAKNDTEILEVRVIHTNPEKAAIIAETFLKNSIDELTNVFKGGSVDIIDNAVVPLYPIGPNKIKNTVMGSIFGIILGLIIVFVLDIFDNRVKSQEDLVNKFGIPVLGMIPSLKSSRKLCYSDALEVTSENVAL